MKKVFIILILGLYTVFLFSNVLAIERVPKKDTSAGTEQKAESKSAPAPEKGETIPPERRVVKPEPQPGSEQPRQGEIKKPQKEQEQGIPRILRESRKGLKEEGKDRYDYFIDRNGNGIDDRLEQQNKNQKPPEQVKKPEERKPPAEKKERHGR